jgi:hypothetical protein
MSAGLVNRALFEGEWELRLALGAQRSWGETDFYSVGGLNYAITDRLSWALIFPAFSYRWGDAGSAELIARGGLTGFGYDGSENVFIGFTDAGLSGQVWLAPELSVLLGASGGWDFQTARSAGEPSRSDDLTLRAALSLSWRLAPALTLSVGAGIAQDLLIHEAQVHYALNSELTLGAIQQLGYRQLPLLQVHLTPTFSIDAYATWGVSLKRSIPDRQWYAAGIGVLF